MRTAVWTTATAVAQIAAITITLLLAAAALAVPQAVAARTRHGPTAAIAWAPALAAGTALVVITRLIAHGTAP